MKLSVSLPEEDVEFLDQYAQIKGYESRSAVVHQAVRLLRASELEPDYACAWAEWTDRPDAEAWDGTSADGLSTR